jgi:mono/diheme cytochrome c family protein
MMPKHDYLKPEQLSELLTYVRQNFGNMPDRISVNDVNRVLAK